jgi:hypothetical protein
MFIKFVYFYSVALYGTLKFRLVKIFVVEAIGTYAIKPFNHRYYFPYCNKPECLSLSVFSTLV